MKLKLTALVLLLISIVQVNGFIRCLTNILDSSSPYGGVDSLMLGFGYGLKGDTSMNTSCSTQIMEMYTKLNKLTTSISDIATNLLQPYYDASDVLIETSNLMVACILETQAAQLNIRTNTEAGLGDLMYTVVQFPIEGFFEQKNNAKLQNQIWDAVNKLSKGWDYEQSMVCEDVGYNVAQVYQALLSFTIPDEILYSEVAA